MVKILIKFLGLVIVQLLNHLDVAEDDQIQDQSIKIFKILGAVIEDLNQDHILLIHHPDLEEEDIKTKERDIAEALEEINESEKEVLHQRDHLLIQLHPKDRIQTQNLDKEWEKKTHFITKEI